ncbi:hypothetical protein SAMN05880582_106119 [Rhizobium sp. RU20A]|uniref:glycosyl transferase n=1 Tax=Rhizobium sp. RU20A TaxID=1907412 RepID=UPI00095431E7|nr:glycosyl transferase [Rhizobium sp. RU20A]SIR08671.1 hypothetical protein SAMN05880582_106119 [Rhizobium sp. RU20A]
MLSVLIEVLDDEAELAATLTVLVAGAVEGLVSDVVILDRGSRDGSSAVADAAGCLFLSGVTLTDAVTRTRGDWLLLLEPGARPMGRWVEEIGEHLAIGGGPARLTPARQFRRSFLTRLTRRQGPLENGCLVRKADALRLAGGATTLAALAVAIRPKRMASEIAPAWVARRQRGG